MVSKKLLHLHHQQQQKHYTMTKQAKKNTLTVLEAEVLNLIINSEYYDVEGEGVINQPTWTPVLTSEQKGALSSCIKKGYAYVDTSDKNVNDHTCWITRSGWDMLNETI